MVEYFSAEGIKKLKEELEYLKTVKTKEIAELLKYSASFGDLSDNAGYSDAKDRQAFLVRRVAELKAILGDAVVYERKETDKIQIGSNVEILLDDETEKMDIVAPGESDILKNKISYQSPLGKKLMGKKEGDEFKFKTAEKKTKVKILKVS
jgi:transcription elongation factor GreA